MEEDLQMDYDEEEIRWLKSIRRREQRDAHKATKPAVTHADEDMEDPQPASTFTPAASTDSWSPPTHRHTVKVSEAPHGLMLNGRQVPVLHAGGGAEQRPSRHSECLASGSAAVQIPVTLTLRGPAGTQHINTLASVTSTPVAAEAPPPPGGDAEAPPTPVITGIISGKAAEKILSQEPEECVAEQAARGACRPAATRPPVPVKSPASPLSSKSPKGWLRAETPPACQRCGSHYRMVPALRGFMCLCSPEVAEGLSQLGYAKKHGWKTSREPEASARIARARRAAGGSSKQHRDEEIADRSSPELEERPLQPRLPEHPVQTKRVILVKDFYYGTCEGDMNTPSCVSGTCSTTHNCQQCGCTLKDNLELMCHARLHMRSAGDRGTDVWCPHCHRCFGSRVTMQAHVVAVHSSPESSVTCRICELAFDTEHHFLWHMKNTHQPGEMPYVCQVCGFRSSFHGAVWTHFLQTHLDTSNFICHYCLQVLQCSRTYQRHLSLHLRRPVFGCQRCRLQFPSAGERHKHRRLHHAPHVPPQLSQLGPGAKVTVRMYRVTGCSRGLPLKVVHVPQSAPTEEPPKKRPRESLGPLLSALRERRPAVCVECGECVEDFVHHFPSVVRCCVCRYLTGCCRAYADHMVSYHTRHQPAQPRPRCPPKTRTHRAMYVSSPRLLRLLVCVCCGLSTQSGDLMANHLMQCGTSCQVSEPLAALSENQGQENQQPSSRHPTHTTLPSAARGGAFVPIHLLRSGSVHTRLDVRPLTSSPARCSSPAMTIRFQHPEKTAPPHVSQEPSRLAAVLCALCKGLPEASQRHQLPAAIIAVWIRQLEEHLSQEKCRQKMEGGVEWLQKEQLKVSEEKLLRQAQQVLGQDSSPLARYMWAVQLLLQPLPPSHAPVRSHNPRPGTVGSVARLSLYTDQDRRGPVRLRWCPGRTLLCDVLVSGLSDGTFLPPLLLFWAPPLSLPAGLPHDVLVEARPLGFGRRQGLDLWMEKVWRPWVVERKGGMCMLMVDKNVEEEVPSGATEPCSAPVGLSPFFQPLEIFTMPMLRLFLQKRFAQLVSDNGVEPLSLEQLCVSVACWLSQAAATLQKARRFLCRSFNVVMQQRSVARHMDVGQTLRRAVVQLVEQDHVERGGQTRPSQKKDSTSSKQQEAAAAPV